MIEMPVLSIFLERRGEQLLEIAVEEILVATGASRARVTFSNQTATAV